MIKELQVVGHEEEEESLNKRTRMTYRCATQQSFLMRKIM